MTKAEYLQLVPYANSGSASLEAIFERMGDYRFLLIARNHIYSKQFSEALLYLEQVQGSDFFITAEVNIIKGLLWHSQGMFVEASTAMLAASVFYGKDGDDFRRLRALINYEILKCDLRSFAQGSLYFLKLESQKKEHWDLVGNIAKAHCDELMNEGQFVQAMILADEAIEHYEKISYPEDTAIAYCLKALCELMCMRIQEATKTFQKITYSGGRVESYKSIFVELTNGYQPKIFSEHTLAKVPWRKKSLRGNTIPAKIIQALTEKALSRDEIISYVWGENAKDPSYCDRLYKGVQKARREYGTAIIFDGEKYHTS